VALDEKVSKKANHRLVRSMTSERIMGYQELSRMVSDEERVAADLSVGGSSYGGGSGLLRSFSADSPGRMIDGLEDSLVGLDDALAGFRAGHRLGGEEVAVAHDNETKPLPLSLSVPVVGSDVRDCDDSGMSTRSEEATHSRVSRGRRHRLSYARIAQEQLEFVPSWEKKAAEGGRRHSLTGPMGSIVR